MYKVLRVEEGQLASFNVGLNHRHSVVYPTNTWVYPKLEGTKLFVFDTYENANRFLQSFSIFEDIMSYSRIYSCSVVNPVNPDYYDLFMPFGTKLVDAVYLEELINVNE